MENRLNEIAERMTEEDTIRFEHSFSDFDDHSVLGNEQHDRILSSLMRKAGFEMKETMSVKKTRKHGKFIGLVIAAAVLMTGALGVYAADTLGIFSRFFKGDISPFESEVLSTVQTVSNEDLTLTIDGIVADEVECKILVSVYANDSEGRKIIKRLEKDPGEDEDYYHGNSQLFLEHHGFDYREGVSYDDEGLIYPSLNNSNEYHIIKGVEMSRVDLSQPFKLTEQESGLSIEFELTPYLESYRLKSDDENAYDYVVLSPMGIHIRSTQNDIDCGRGFDLIDDASVEVYVNYADGSQITLDGVSIGQEYSSSIESVTSQETLVNERLDANPTIDGKPSFFSVDNVVSVTINGVEYTK